MIDRRAALSGVAALFGGGLFAPLARAEAAGVDLHKAGSGVADTVFTPVQRATLTAFSERILPSTDTPGAIAAGVPSYIDQLLAEWALPPDRALIGAGLDLLEAKARADYGAAAADLKDADQDALLTLAMNDQLPGGRPFFQAFRQMVIAGYYTSEIGTTIEREYLPVPGDYDGAYPYVKVGKVFSA